MTAPDIEGLAFLEPLGSGGYSEVYLYERRTPRMRVAVKVLKDARLSDAERAQFAAEAETMAELADHPYIVQVFSTGALADGRPYLVMKYYPPPSLDVRAARDRLSVADVLRTGVKIASAVETAHRAGILHRDIKPANILVSQYGEPGLTDFGIAGRATATDDADDLGVSLPWSAPEVLAGSSNGTVASDVYALGATMWHLLAGRSPFEVPAGDNSARSLMARVLRSPVPRTGRAEVPATLERLLAQAMAKSPAARPRSALEFAQGLQAVEQEQRFARTEIVVEGLGPTQPSGVRTPAREEGERTRLRAPVRPIAPPPAPSGRSPAGPSTTRPTGPDSPATVRRPARVESPAAGPRVRAESPGAGAGLTVRRPVGTEPSAELPAPRRGLRRRIVLAVAGGVIVLAVVVGVVLSSGGGGTPGRTSSSNPASVSSQDLLPPGTTGTAPTVTARYDAARHVVDFSWAVSGSTAGGSWGWYPAGEPAAEKRVTRATVQLSTTDPAHTCIQVLYIGADGQPSPPSAPRCGR